VHNTGFPVFDSDYRAATLARTLVCRDGLETQGEAFTPMSSVNYAPPMTTRILLVDDHPIVREGLRTVLQRRPGCEVVGEASNGMEAIEKAESLQPDVIVLDITMPKMNGLEVCRILRKNSQDSSSEVPEVLFVTQHDSPQMMREALGAGAKGYVVKSNAARDLLEAIDVVSQHKVFTALARPDPATRS
jgi:DNA-binding NarL/FixJ family response regulator